MALTQHQIAELAGVSRGTVDRVLKNRGHVSPEVEARVRKIIEENGYKVNKVGASLKRSKKRLKFGVIVQSVETPFMYELLKLLEAYESTLEEQGVELVIRTIVGINIEQQLDCINELIENEVNGIAMTPAEDERIHKKINSLYEETGIPVVTFNTDTPDSKRICYVGEAGILSGRAAAGLMDILVTAPGKIIMINGHKDNYAHTRRIDGFVEEMGSINPDLELLPVAYCEDNDRKAYELVKKSFAKHTDIKGVYIAANGQVGVCDALRELGLDQKIKMVCHDNTEDIKKNIRSGCIDFAIDQHVQRQAQEPIDILYEYCTTGVAPRRRNHFVTLEYKNRYNI